MKRPPWIEPPLSNKRLEARDRALGALLRFFIEAAPHGARAYTVRWLSDLTGLSAATIYRRAGLGGTPRPRRKS